MPVYLDETDHHALVVDIGTTSTKLGHAGELCPRIISSNYIKTTGQLNDAGSNNPPKRQFTTLSHIDSRQYLESDFPEADVVQLIGNDYEITDFSLFEEIINDQCSNNLQIDLSETPILVSDSICCQKGQRQKISEMLFEKFRIPSVYFANNSILSSFANGKVSSFVVDVGENSTILAPILEGYILQKLMIRSPLSGQLIKLCARATFDKLELDYTPKYLTNITDSDSICMRSSQFKNLSNALVDLELNGFVESMLEVSAEPLNQDNSDCNYFA